MTSEPELEEVYASESKVLPGWTYNKSIGKFFPSDSKFEIATVTCLKYDITTYSGERLESFKRSSIYCSRPLKKDLWKINRGNGLLVKVEKIKEIRGSNIEIHDHKHTVIAVHHKCFADMLIHFTQQLEDDVIKETKIYVNEALYGISECFIPKKISKFFDFALIYKDTFSEGVMINEVKECMKNFCQLLQNSYVSKFPITMLLQKPRVLVSNHSLETGKYTKNSSNLPVTTCVVHEKGCQNTHKENVAEKSYAQKRSSDKTSVSTEKPLLSQGQHQIHACTGSQILSSGTCQNENPQQYVQEELRCHKISTSGEETITYTRTQPVEVHTTHSKPQGKDLQYGIHQENSGSSVKMRVRTYENRSKNNNSVCSYTVTSNIDDNAQNRECGLRSSNVGASSSLEVSNLNHPMDVKGEHVTFSTSKTATYKNMQGPISGDFYSQKGQEKITDENKKKLVNKPEEEDVFYNERTTTITHPFLPAKEKEQCNKDLVSSIQLTLEGNLKTSVTNSDKSVVSGDSKDMSECSIKSLSQTGNTNSIDHQKVNGRNQEIAQSLSDGFHSQKSQEKLIDNYGNKSEEKNVFYNERTTTITQPTKEKEQCNKDHVPGKQMTSVDNLQTSITNSDICMVCRESKDITKDSDKSISQSGNINSTDLQKANGRNQEIAQSLKKENKHISEAKENLRCNLVQNDKAVSQTQEKLSKMKSNSKQESVKPHTLKPVKSQKDPSGMERKYYGIYNSKLKEKVLILFGASGSGKTTLVNFIGNYFHGAKSAEDAIMCADLGSSKVRSTTTIITAYTFCNDENETPITVIDTPGLSDSSRTQGDGNIQLLKTFLENVASNDIEIHAIGFVAPAQLVRLSSSEQLIFDYVKSLFGQSVVDHLITLVTAADNTENPPVVEAMKNCNIKSKTIFKFNNSTFGNTTEEYDEFAKVYWKRGCKSWKKCLKLLLELPHLSINTFKALQSKVYSENVIESAANDLKDKLKTFICYYKDLKYLTKESFIICEQVWESAAAFNHLRCTQESGVSDVETIMVSVAKEMCKENNFNSVDCIELLFLGRSKGLLGAGIGVIRSMGPLYEKAKRSQKPKENPKKMPSILHCTRCNADHKIKREIYSGLMNFIPGLGKSAEIITFKCTECECDGNLHNVSSKGKLQSSFDLSSELLLKTTKTSLENLLKEKSPPGYAISKKKYLHHINIALGYKFEMLIYDILSTYNK
nr:uncharacterized protein LOC128700649 isoform X1 [Cherax quadricarinatus]